MKIIKKFTKEKEELRNYGFSENVMEKLIRLVSLDDYLGHLKARDELTSMGVDILPDMHKLMNSRSAIIRNEAIKIIRRIGDITSLQVTIDLLEDNDEDIRWNAAETLISMGRESLRPLLKKLIGDNQSIILHEGVHHVLSELIRNDDARELKELQHLIMNLELQETIRLKAIKILSENLI